jgi:hypothetical protein
MCRVRLVDEDAKAGCCKDIVDGLRYAGLLLSDAAGSFRLEVGQVKAAHYAEQETLIDIIYP